MSLINKRTGTQEEFDRAKVKESIVRAGATEQTARQIASRIDSNKLRTTEELRRRVAEELRKTDIDAAERYEKTRNLAAKKAMETAQGIVKLHIETMKALGANPSDSIIVEHRGNKRSLIVETANIERDEMHLNEMDLKTLGATEGVRLAVTRSR